MAFNNGTSAKIMSAIRTERLLNLLTLLLNSRRPIALREIRELDEFGAYRTDDPKSGERAFERDKAALVELGVPLRWVAPEQEDEDDGLGGYIVDRARYYLPDLKLTPGELALLSIAGAAAAGMDGFVDKPALVRALAKLGFDAGEMDKKPTLAHAPLLPGVDSARIGTHLAVLHDSVANLRRVELRYAGIAADARPTVRQLDPYGLYYRQGSWYLVGFCHLRQAERTFAVARIDHVRTQGPTHAYTCPKDFDLRAHVEKRPWEFPLTAGAWITLRLAERLRPAVAEIFGRRAKLEDTPEGLRVQVWVTHPQAFVHAVLPYGAAAEVLEPVPMRAVLKQIYERLAKCYAHPVTLEVCHACE